MKVAFATAVLVITYASGQTCDSTCQKVLQLVNQERANAGREPLCLNDKLMLAAQLHSEDQASCGKMSHTGCDGSSMVSRVKYVFILSVYACAHTYASMGAMDDPVSACPSTCILPAADADLYKYQ